MFGSFSTFDRDSDYHYKVTMTELLEQAFDAAPEAFKKLHLASTFGVISNQTIITPDQALRELNITSVDEFKKIFETKRDYKLEAMIAAIVDKHRIENDPVTIKTINTRVNF